MHTLNVILAKFRLDAHHKMERFVVIFSAFVLAFMAIFTISFKIHLDHQKVILTTQALYTNATVWSITGEKMAVCGIYRNDTSSKVFILLKAAGGPESMSNLPTNANDYQIFMTGYGKDKLTNDPRGAVYMFGNTGYMGLFFVDSKGLDPHVYDIVVRNNNVLVTEPSQTGLEMYAGKSESFRYHDQIQIFANLAGTDAEVKDFLNKDNPTVDEIYADVVASIDESSVRAKLDKDLVNMNEAMMKVNQYADALTRLQIQIPVLPDSIGGDGISLDSTISASNPTEFSKDMIQDVSSIITSSYESSEVAADQMFATVEIGDLSTENEDGTVTSNPLYMGTDYVFPGGVQFNYEDLKLTDRILDQLKPADVSYDDWVASKKIEADTYRNIGNALDLSYYKNWFRFDGTKFEYNENGSSNVDAATQGAIKNYVSAVQSLYTAKYNYQTSDLYELLRLENLADTSTATFSINASENVLTMY